MVSYTHFKGAFEYVDYIDDMSQFFFEGKIKMGVLKRILQCFAEEILILHGRTENDLETARALTENDIISKHELMSIGTVFTSDLVYAKELFNKQFKWFNDTVFPEDKGEERVKLIEELKSFAMFIKTLQNISSEEYFKTLSRFVALFLYYAELDRVIYEIIGNELACYQMLDCAYDVFEDIHQVFPISLHIKYDPDIKED